MSILKLKDSQGNWVGVPTLKGDKGNGIQSAVLNNDYTLTLTFTDGTTYTTPSIRGEKGEQGEPATDMDIHICSTSEYDSETRIPTITSPDDKTFYLVPTEDGTSPDLFTEWVYVNNAWEMFGSASVDLTDYIKNTDYATGAKAGVIKLNPNYGINVTDDGILYINTAESKNAKMGTNNARPITPIIQHESIFYGLAKASGTDEKDSTLPVGQYTDEAKSSIQDMLDVPSTSELKEINDSKADVIVESATGDIISFDDGADDMPLKSLVVDINPVQDLNGYDSPWVGGAGKNLLNLNRSTIVDSGSHPRLEPKDFNEDQIWVGLSFNDYFIPSRVSKYNIAEDTVSLTITSSGYGIGFPIKCEAETSYAISQLVVSDENICFGIGFYDETGTYISSQSQAVSKVFTTPSTCEWLVVVFAPKNAQAETIYTKPQLEKGSTITSYAPYENICPISGWTGMQFQKTGVNIWNGTLRNDVFVPFSTKVGVQYFVSAKIVDSTQSTYLYVRKRIVGDTSKGTVFKYIIADKTVNPQAFTAEAGYEYGLWSNSSYTNVTDVQIEIGSSATAYEPYNGTTIPISWQTEAGTVYGGKLDVFSGVMRVDRAMVDLGTLTWEYDSGFNSFRSRYSITDALSHSYSVTTGLLTSIGLTELGKMAEDAADLTIVLNSNAHSKNSLFIKYLAYDDVSAFKSAMSGVQMCYYLATPIEYQLTPQEVKSLLGQNNIWADTGNTSVEYCADTEMYIEKVKPVINVNDVQINGTSVVADGVANVPLASPDNYGVVKIGNGVTIVNVGTNKLLSVNRATDAQVKEGTQIYRPITPVAQDSSTFYGLAKAAGADEKDSILAFGTYSDNAKSSIQNMLGITDKYSPKEWVAESETELVINAHNIGELFYIGETLYKVIADLNAGDAINVGVNVEEVNANDVLNDYVTKEDIENNISIVEKSASGSIASFSDGADDLPLKSLVVNIDPVQDLHGYDSPWVGGGGKNLLEVSEANLEKPSYYSGTWTGTTISDAKENSITVSRTNNQGGFAGVVIPNGLKAGTYTFSCDVPVTASSKSFYIGYTENGVFSGQKTLEAVSASNTHPYKSFTLENDTDSFYIKMAGATGDVPLTFSHLQIEAGATATTYAPYENICPISGWTQVDVYDDPMYGGNIEWNQLCDNDFVNNYQKSGGASITKTGNSYTITYGTSNALFYLSAAYRKLYATSGQKILVMVKNYDTANKGTSTVRFSFETSLTAGNTIDETLPVSGAAIYTARSNIYGFGLYAIQNQDGNKISFDAISVFNLTQMFGEGNEPSTVEEFRALFPEDYYEYNEGEKTTVSAVNEKPYTHVNIQLGQTVYGGKLDVLSGVLTINSGSFKVSDYTWTRYSTEGAYKFYCTPTGIKRGANVKHNDSICSEYVVVPFNNLMTTPYAFSDVANGTGRISVHDPNFYNSTAQEFMTAKADVRFVYPLATPITVRLSPTEVKSLLGQNNIFADTGDTEVEYFSQVDKDLIDYIETSLKPYAKEERLNDYISDVQINGQSIVENGMANIPIGENNLGVVKCLGNQGISISTSGILYISPTNNADIKSGNNAFSTIKTSNQDVSTFYGLAKVAGHDEKDSELPVGTYTDEAKTAIKQMLGIHDTIDSFVEEVTGTDVTITGQPSYRYNCGELYSLTVTPPSSGTIDIRFTSGSTPTVLTLPSTVKMPEWWVEVETNTIYEMCITDGIYCGVMTWAI